MSKIIFLDVDGTLVDYTNDIPGSAVRVIRTARANGHRVYICTGRSRAEVYDDIWEIGIDGMIGGDGSYVEDRRHVVSHQLITPEQTKRIVEWLNAKGLEFYLESNNGLFASPHFEEAAQPAIQLYSQRKGKDNVEALTVRDVFPEMIFGGELLRDDLNKVSYLLNSYDDYLEAIKAFPDLECKTWGGAGETALFGDFSVKGITKAHAIDTLLDYLGRSREDTIAFGDAKVDIPMIDYCKIGVAMGNGGAEIKEAADYITDDVENDGLEKAFKHFGLI